jgi:ubiquinone/menaquinone biosynthesis C-methylase UbiE
MDQIKIWEEKWGRRGNEPPNNFAKRCFLLIKKRHLKTLLDVGCGNGRDSLYFARKGLKVTAVDFSKNGLKLLKRIIDRDKIKNITPICRETTKLNFKDNSFDVIYAHLSLHYFYDKTTTKIFDKLYKMLKKNGLIFIKCKSTDDAFYGEGKKVEENIFIKKNQIRHFFDKDYMKEKLEKFKILKIRKTSSVYRHYKSSFIEAAATK